MVNTKVQKAKDKHKKEMDLYAQSIKDFIKGYGPAECDYLAHRKDMETYHRGAWNALCELERELND